VTALHHAAEECAVLAAENARLREALEMARRRLERIRGISNGTQGSYGPAMPAIEGVALFAIGEVNTALGAEQARRALDEGRG